MFKGVKNKYLENINNLDENSISTLERIINTSKEDFKKNNKIKKSSFLLILLKYIIQLLKIINK